MEGGVTRMPIFLPAQSTWMGLRIMNEPEPDFNKKPTDGRC